MLHRTDFVFFVDGEKNHYFKDDFIGQNQKLEALEYQSANSKPIESFEKFSDLLINWTLFCYFSQSVVPCSGCLFWSRR